MQCRFSIIIPTFNRAHLIQETLDSVRRQTLSDFECIVVDDGSSDNTREVVELYCQNDGRFSYCQRPHDRLKGANACRNFGLEKTTGTYINWLDSDDLFAADHLEKHWKYHQSNEGLEASVSRAGTFSKAPFDSDEMWSKIDAKGDLITNMIASRVSWQTAAVLWEKSHLPEKPFNEALSSSQEWTFHLEQLIRKVNYKLLFETTVFVRRHDDRIGTAVSAEKYRATFLSRFLILKTLNTGKLLNPERNYFLLRKVFQAVKNAIRHKYDSVLFFQLNMLLRVFFISERKWEIIKLIFFSIPLFRITGKGETLFNLKR